MASPFKFLDAYTLEDRDIFFGREQEIEEMYRKVFESKILLVYGISGTGKTSLINCGLANKFEESDWMPVFVRRGRNLPESLRSEIRKCSLTPLQSPGKKPAPGQIVKSLQSLYLDHFKPVYLVFDQFEELFIFGDREERRQFMQVVKAVADSDVQCRMIFSIREEYLAGVTEFEELLPDFMGNRMRVEKMTRQHALQVIEGPCCIHGIGLEEGFAEALLEKLNPSSNEVELTYLQVILDKIHRIAQSEKPAGSEGLSFTLALLEKTGNVSDILGSFLDEQISRLDNPEEGLAVLKSFVSVKGTKRQMSPAEVSEYAHTLGKPVAEADLQEVLQNFIQLRILRDRDQNDRYELRHDALAMKIYEKITLVEKELLEIRQLIENAFNSWEKRGILLSEDDLQYIAPYETRLYLPEEYDKLIERSKNELVKKKRRRRNILSAAAIALIIVLGGFTLWAMKERKNAMAKERMANEAKIQATESEREAIKARDRAVESDRRAVASEKEALEARDRALESEQRIKREKAITELRERQARANNFNYLSKEITAQDPTIALHLALHALSLDPHNRAILSNLHSIYYDHSFYQIFFRDIPDNLCQISPDWTKMISTSGRTARLTDLKENISRLFIGHILPGGLFLDVHQFTRRGHDDIWSIAFSPDGNHYLTGSADKTARLWDSSGNMLQVFRGHILHVLSVAFSPDGTTVLTGSADKTARLWDLQGNCLQVFTGHRFDVFSAAFSPDGKTILTGSADSTAILWDLQGNIIQRFEGHTDFVRVVAFSPDGRTVLTGSFDRTTRLWDLNGNTLQVFRGHTDRIRALAFSPDGKTILTGSSDNTARLWDLTGNAVQVFNGHTGTVNSVAFSPEGNSILTFSADGTSRVWDLSQMKYTNLAGHNDFIYKAIFSPDGKNILTTSNNDKTVKLWDTDGNCLKDFKLMTNAIAFSPDSKTFLIGFLTLQLLDLNGKVIRTFTGQNIISSVAFSPDGKTILSGSPDRTVRLWDLNANILQVFSGHSDLVISLCFSPDGKYILTGSFDNTARLWDLNGNTLRIFKGHQDRIMSVAFSPDGKTILTGSGDHTARLWNLRGNLLQVFTGHSDRINSVCFSPDGKTLATGSDDKTVRIWDLRGNTLQVIRGSNSAIWTVAFSPSGKTILTGYGDNMARLTSLKMPLDEFLKEGAAENLNTAQSLQYQVISADRLDRETDVGRLFEGIRYCLAQARLKDQYMEEHLDRALSLLKKTGNSLSEIENRKQFLSCGLEIYSLKPQKDLLKMIAEANCLFLSASSIDEVKEAYEFYSDKCSSPDSVQVIMKLPQCFIQTAEKLLRVDTTARHTISTDLAALSWPLLQYRQFKTAMDAISVALEADSANEFIYLTLPLVLLLNGRYEEAERVYLEYYKKYMFGGSYGLFKNFRLCFLEDIDALKGHGITHPDFDKVKQLLNN